MLVPPESVTVNTAFEPSATVAPARDTVAVSASEASSVIVVVAVFAVGLMVTLAGSGVTPSAAICTSKVSEASDSVSAVVATVNADERVSPAAMVSEVAACAV